MAPTPHPAGDSRARQHPATCRGPPEYSAKKPPRKTAPRSGVLLCPPKSPAAYPPPAPGALPAGLPRTHRPLGGRPHGAGGRWAGGRFPTSPLWVRLAKNRLTSSRSQPWEPAFTLRPTPDLRRGAYAPPAPRCLPATHTELPTPDLNQGAYPPPVWETAC